MIFKASKLKNTKQAIYHFKALSKRCRFLFRKSFFIKPLGLHRQFSKTRFVPYFSKNTACWLKRTAAFNFTKNFQLITWILTFFYVKKAFFEIKKHFFSSKTIFGRVFEQTKCVRRILMRYRNGKNILKEISRTPPPLEIELVIYKLGGKWNKSAARKKCIFCWKLKRFITLPFIK